MENMDVVSLYREVLTGKRQRFPTYLFDGEDGKDHLAYLTRYLIEEYLSIPLDNIPSHINAKILWNHRLRPAAKLHGLDFMELIQMAYPNKFSPWEFKQVSHGYWIGEKGQQRAIETVQHLIEHVCQIPLDEIPRQINYLFFKKYKIGGIFNVFGESPYRVINAVYPNQFQPWQFAHVPNNYWKNTNHIKQKMDWLLFEKLLFPTYFAALTAIKRKHFHEHQALGIFKMAFNCQLSLVRSWISEQIILHDQI